MVSRDLDDRVSLTDKVRDVGPFLNVSPCVECEGVTQCDLWHLKFMTVDISL